MSQPEEVGAKRAPTRSAQLADLILANLSEYAVFATDLSGKVMSCNPGVEALLGYTYETFVGQDFRLLFTEDDRVAGVPEQEMATAGEVGYAADERWHVRADGSTFFAHGILSALRDEDGQLLGYAKVLRDATDERSAMLTLETSKQYLRDLIDHMPTFVGLTTPDGVLLEVNRPVVKATSLTFADVIDKPLYDLPYWTYSDEAKAEIRDAVARAREGEASRFDTVIHLGPRVGTHASEDRFMTVDFMLVPIFNEAKEVTYLIPSGVDVTERRRDEVTLRESETLFRATVQHAPIPMIVHTATGEILQLSRAFTELTGYRKEDLPDSASWLRRGLHVPEEDIASWHAQLEQRDTPPPNELTIYTASGETRTWRVYGSEPLPLGGGQYFVTAALDITEQRRAEDAQEKSEVRYRTLFNATDEGFCVIEVLFDADDKPLNYRFLETNPRFEDQTGLKNAVGKTARDLVPNLEQHWFDLYGEVALTGEPTRFENGSREMGRWFEVYAFRVGDVKSRRVGILFKDITERKQAENALADLNRELEARVEARTKQVQDLAGQLTLAEARERAKLAQVLHDGVQQQLYAVQFALRDIRRAAKDNDEMQAQLSKTNALVKEALQLARITTTDLSPPVLKEEGLVEALKWLSSDMKRRHRLSVTVDTADALTVPDEAVRVLLFNLVRELLFNVVKHAEVEAATVTLSEQGDGLSICVSDLGCGFNPAALDREGFGTGLGLSGVRKRLQLFGGRLDVASMRGQGTQVTILMPTSALMLN